MGFEPALAKTCAILVQCPYHYTMGSDSCHNLLSYTYALFRLFSRYRNVKNTKSMIFKMFLIRYMMNYGLNEKIWLRGPLKNSLLQKENVKISHFNFEPYSSLIMYLQDNYKYVWRYEKLYI